MTSNQQLRQQSRDFQESHQQCFTCGASNPNGLHLEFAIREDGVAVATWKPANVHQSYAGRVHGGILSSLLDSAMVHALLARSIQGVTAELNIRFRLPVSSANPLEIRASRESSRRGIHYCRAEIEQDGAIAVTATAKFLALPDS